MNEPLASAGGQEETSHVTRGSEDSSVAPEVESRAVSSSCRERGEPSGDASALEKPPPQLGTLPPPRVCTSVRVCEKTKCT